LKALGLFKLKSPSFILHLHARVIVLHRLSLERY
jgi:hypothetical protein